MDWKKLRIFYEAVQLNKFWGKYYAIILCSMEEACTDRETNRWIGESTSSVYLFYMFFLLCFLVDTVTLVTTEWKVH